MKRKVVFTSIGLVWLLTMGMGIKILSDYAASAGEAATPPDRWPATCRIQPAPGSATLVLLVHPHCPCTRATIRELALLMAKCDGKLTAYVAFYKPSNFADDWERTDLWDAASEIPGVSVLSDEDGSLASSFNASTSGQALLYDSTGQLMFAGGITAARGHSGDNAGSDAVVSLLAKLINERVATPVYGCPLFDRHSECQEGVQKCPR